MGRVRMFRWLCVLLTVALLVGCGSSLRDRGTAADAMDRFHKLFNAGEYGKIYDTADVDFQSRNVRGDFVRMLDETHRKLGDYRTCQSRDWTVNNGLGDTRVTLRYRTTFTGGEADEEFVYVVAGTRATLRSYHVDSKMLTAR